jgi:hypothetical protein
MMRAMRDRPRTQRVLYLWVQPLFGGDPPFDDPEVDPSKGGRLLQRGQLAQRNLRVISIHRQQQHSARVSVQLVGQLKECHTIHAGQLQIGGDNGYLGALARQLLQAASPVVAESAVTMW